MKLKNRVMIGLAAAALVVGGVVAAPVAAYATGNPSHLDQGDLSLQCQMQNHASGWIAHLNGTTAYSWQCVYTGGGKSPTGIDINAYCMYLAGVWAASPNPSDPYSWHCQGY